jgi:hypothetical protein
MIDARVDRDVHALLNGQSSRKVEDAVEEVAEGWDREPRTIWRKLSVTAKSSDTI